MTTVADVRDALWPDGLPRTMPDAIVPTYRAGAQAALHPSDIDTCDVVHHLLAGGVWATSFFYRPKATPRQQALIYCIGHSQDWSLNWITVGEALRRGVSVVEIWMRGYLNWPPYADQMPFTYTCLDASTIPITVHNDFALIDAHGGERPSVRLHLDVVPRVVAWLQQRMGPTRIGLAGHSGGGWTSVINGAFDDEIDFVASIHGWCPMNATGAPARDYEQTTSSLFASLDYPDYSTAIGTRRQLICTGSADPVFGAGVLGQSNIDAMVADIQAAGGTGLTQQTFTAPDHSVVAEEATWVLDEFDALGAPDYVAPRWTGALATAQDLARIASSLAGYPTAYTSAYVAVDTGSGTGRIDLATQDHARLYDSAQVATLSGSDQTIVLAQRDAFIGRA